jgi:hypothetical protein
MMRAVRFFTCSLVMACLTWLIPALALAQTESESSMVPVLVMMPNRGASTETDILITRHAEEGYRVVIPRVLATPENVAAAIRALFEIVDRDGDAKRDGQVFRIQPIEPGTVKSDGVGRHLLQLLHNAQSDTGQAHKTPAVTIYLPAAAERAARRVKDPGRS